MCFTGLQLNAKMLDCDILSDYFVEYKASPSTAWTSAFIRATTKAPCRRTMALSPGKYIMSLLTVSSPLLGT